MALPQPGIFAVGTFSHAYVELDLTADADPAAPSAVLADVAERETTMGATNLVVGVRPEVWARGLARHAARRADRLRGRPWSDPTASRCPPPSTTWRCGSRGVVRRGLRRDDRRDLRSWRRTPTSRSELERLGLPPRPRPHRLRGRHREPDARRARPHSRRCRTARPARAARCCCSSSGHDDSGVDGAPDAGAGAGRSGGPSRTASSSTPSRRPRTRPAPTRTTSATCCAATRRTARSATTARCSSASPAAGRRSHTMLESMAGVDGPRDALTRYTTPLTGRLLLGAGHVRPGRVRDARVIATAGRR